MLLQEPVRPAPIALVESVPTINKTRFREQWKCRVVDEAKVPREYMTPDLLKLGEAARAQKGQARVPGVEFYDASLGEST